jgi:purine nucleosidase
MPEHTPEKPKPSPRPTLIDCDAGIDDALAILLAVRSPELNILGITTAAGNVPVTLAARNAGIALEIGGRPDIPVYLGAEKPLVCDLVTAQDTHGMDGLGETNLPAPSQPARPGAVDFLEKTLRESPEPVTIFALAPLTNIALLFRRDPDLVRTKARLVIMGGTVKSHGNSSPVSEFNFWVDPHAAAEVFAAAAMITLVPLDVTREILFTPTLRELTHYLATPVGDFVHAITRFYTDFHWNQERVLGCVINDPLAIAIAIDPTLAVFEKCFMEVATDGVSRGQSIADLANFHRRSPNCEFAFQVDAQRFFQLFLERLFPEKVAEIHRHFHPPAPYIVRHA